MARRNMPNGTYRVGKYLGESMEDRVFDGRDSLAKAREHARENSRTDRRLVAVWNGRDELVVLFVDQVPFIKER